MFDTQKYAFNSTKRKVKELMEDYVIDKSNWNNVLARLRIAKKFKQHQLLPDNKSSATYISRIEHGKITPNLLTFFSILERLDMEIVIREKRKK